MPLCTWWCGSFRSCFESAGSEGGTELKFTENMRNTKHANKTQATSDQRPVQLVQLHFVFLKFMPNLKPPKDDGWCVCVPCLVALVQLGCLLPTTTRPSHPGQRPVTPSGSQVQLYRKARQQPTIYLSPHHQSDETARTNVRQQASTSSEQPPRRAHIEAANLRKVGGESSNYDQFILHHTQRSDQRMPNRLLRRPT
jgi:hypothetical protein